MLSSLGMHNPHSRFQFSPLTLCWSLVVVLGVSYVGLIAVVMSYAAATVGFSQSVKKDEAAVAVLESSYLVLVKQVTNMDYVAAGYAKPVAQVFVPAVGVTALR